MYTVVMEIQTLTITNRQVINSLSTNQINHVLAVALTALQAVLQVLQVLHCQVHQAKAQAQVPLVPIVLRVPVHKYVVHGVLQATAQLVHQTVVPQAHVVLFQAPVAIVPVPLVPLQIGVLQADPQVGQVSQVAVVLKAVRVPDLLALPYVGQAQALTQVLVAKALQAVA